MKVTRAAKDQLALLQEVDGLEVVQASPRKAVGLAGREKFDCMVITAASLTASVATTADRLAELAGGRPLILWLSQQPSEDDRQKLDEIGATVIAGESAPSRLLAELSVVLHFPAAALPAEARQLVEEFYRQDPLLKGRRIAIIDDDVRNIFALTAILEQYEAEIVHSENGRDGIALVNANPDIEAVLVDIMMPDVDGYEVMREIRKNNSFKTLPIIAVTAKAMEEDRAKCFEAGASGYLSKPVQTDELLAVLRAQLKRRKLQ